MFYLTLKVLHILAGTIALLAGLAAILFRKNTKRHKPVGRIYFWSMTFIFFSAVIMSVYKTNLFLFCVAFFSYYSCLTAYRALKLKRLHVDQNASWFDWAFEVFFGLMHFGFIALGAYLVFQNSLSFGIISCVFGIIGLRGNYITLLRLRKQIVYKNYWLMAHIGGMLGSYIGAITAFLVNNNRWIHAPDIVVWLGPAAVIVPLIIFEVKKYKKAGKLEADVV
jgi:hypothetical protein